VAGTSGGRPCDERTVEGALRKLDEERRWRHRERRACRALGGANSHAQYAAQAGTENVEANAPLGAAHCKPSPKASPNAGVQLSPAPPTAPTAPAAPAPPGLYLPPATEARIDWGGGGDAAFREQFSLSRATPFGRRAGEPRSVGRQAASETVRDNLTAGRFDFPHLEDEAATDERYGADRANEPCLASPPPLPPLPPPPPPPPPPAFAPMPAVELFSPPPLLLSPTPPLTLPSFELPASAYEDAADGVEGDWGCHAGADGDADVDWGCHRGSHAVGEAPMPLGVDNHQSTKDKVLARREIRKRAEAAEREGQLLHARQRYFQERVLADHAQRSQYCGHMGPLLGAERAVLRA